MIHFRVLHITGLDVWMITTKVHSVYMVFGPTFYPWIS